MNFLRYSADQEVLEESRDFLGPRAEATKAHNLMAVVARAEEDSTVPCRQVDSLESLVSWDRPPPHHPEPWVNLVQWGSRLTRCLKDVHQDLCCHRSERKGSVELCRGCRSLCCRLRPALSNHLRPKGLHLIPQRVPEKKLLLHRHKSPLTPA